MPNGVPAGAEGVILFCGGYLLQELLAASSNFTTGAWTIEQLPQTDGEDLIAVAYARVTSLPSSPEITLQFVNGPASGPTPLIAFFGDIPESGAWLLDIALDHKTGGGPPTATANSSADTIVIAFESNEFSTPGTVAGWTSLRTNFAQDQGARLHQLDGTPGATTTFTGTGGGSSFPSCAVVSVLGVETGGGVTGELAVTLGALTASGTGDALVQGAAANTLGALTLAGAGDVLVDGQAAVTLGAVQLSAEGVVVQPGEITGSAAITLGQAQLSAAGDARVAGSAAIALSGLLVAAQGSVPAQGAAAITLGALTLESNSEAATRTGELNVTLSELALVAAGDAVVAGAGAVVLGRMTLEAAGALPVIGQAGITLDALTLRASSGRPTPTPGYAVAAQSQRYAVAAGARNFAISGTPRDFKVSK